MVLRDILPFLLACVNIPMDYRLVKFGIKIILQVLSF